MSALLGAFGPAGQDETALRRMLARMGRRGASCAEIWRGRGAALAVARHDWEMAAWFSGAVLAVNEGPCTIVADASIYYRDDLRCRLGSAGVQPTRDTPAHLILAAYRAWGVRCAEHLEGDFAFVLWDAAAQRVVAARDFVGSRPLHWAELRDGTLLLASTLGGVVAHPALDPMLDPVELAMEAAGLGFTMTARTVYKQARRLNPGETLVRERNASPVVAPHWSLATEPSTRASSFEEGAEELRALLARAVHERLAPDGPTAIWLSGGHDSTAVFAAGEVALASAGGRPPILPVSLRLPADDPGCETHLIEAVAGRWRRPIHWVDSRTVPLVADVARAARERDEPWSPDYQQLSLAWCDATRAVGARVALNGHGGDLLFMSSPVILADYLRQLRLHALWTEWRTVLGGRPREFVRWAVLPLLPDPVLRLITAARGGRRPRGHFERPLPPWFRRDFREANGLDALVATGSPRTSRGSRNGHEMAWLATHPHMGRLTSDHQGNALTRGADSRSPLMDARVVAFAARRPASDRRRLREGKRILRQAMTGLLPREVVAPRPVKTGTLADYARRAFGDVVSLLRDLGSDPILAQLGIVDAKMLARVIDFAAEGHADLYVRSGLIATLHAEHWLRARAAGAEATPRMAREPAGV